MVSAAFCGCICTPICINKLFYCNFIKDNWGLKQSYQTLASRVSAGILCMAADLLPHQFTNLILTIQLHTAHNIPVQNRYYIYIHMETHNSFLYWCCVVSHMNVLERSCIATALLYILVSCIVNILEILHNSS